MFMATQFAVPDDALMIRFVYYLIVSYFSKLKKAMSLYISRPILLNLGM